MFTIGINDGERVVHADGGRSLLSTLADAGIWLPSICGGTTSCGECACVLRGEVPAPTSIEGAILGESRLASGMRLACSVPVESDMEITLPPEVMAVRRRTARVAEVRNIARDTRELLLDLGDEALNFAPGQYLRVMVPPHQGLTESLQRAYSFASPPGNPVFSIIVRRSPGGLASVWLHDALAVGDAIDIVGPFGSFSIEESLDPLVCVAGGTGLAPFLPILDRMEVSGALASRDVYLIFGAKERVDLFRHDELLALARRESRFRFLPVLQQADPEWKGERGLVTEVLARLLDAKNDPERKWRAALCGSPGMVKACERVLMRHGVGEEAIRHDSFA